MKYLNLFEQRSDYQTFKTSEGGGVRPQVNYIKEGKRCVFEPLIKASVGDVVYWTGSRLKAINLENFSESMGTPVGVCVIPTGFAPDGRARIVSLYGVDGDGNKVSSNINLVWNSSDIDTSLTNYSRIPTTDNNGSTSTGSSNTYGYLPSDRFTGATSFVDSKAKYSSSNRTPYIPSPYLGDNPNPEYYKTLEGNNLLSDFNGLSNTQTLISLGSDYQAANACWKYNDGSSNLQWYLPAMGELGYIMPRFNEINNVIRSLGGFTINNDYNFWSSSEFGGNNATLLYTYTGLVNYTYLYNPYLSMRPFSII